MKSIVTDYTELSAFSARPKECDHHLIYGSGLRDLADQDGLILPLCNDEHNICSDGDRTKIIHGNTAAGKLSKMLGQVVWEQDYIARRLAIATKSTAESWRDEARGEFRKRYGISYL